MDVTREVHVLANKGYNGYFVTHEYRDQNRPNNSETGPNAWRWFTVAFTSLIP